MKLSDIDPKDIQLVSPPVSAPVQSGSLKLSDVDPGDIETVDNNPNHSGVTAGTTGFINGATLGFAPALAGIAGAGMDAITGTRGPLNGGGLSDLVDDYRERRDKVRNDEAEANRAHPVISGAANLAGGLVTTLGAGPTPVTGLQRVAQAGTYGGLNALGNSSADLTKGEFKKTIIDTAKGAGAGVALGTIGEGLGAAYNKLTPAGLKDYAESQAVKAIGTAKAAYKKLIQQGGVNEGENGVNSLGRSLLDNDVITPGASMDDKLAAAQKLSQTSGQAIGDTYSNLDQAGIDTFSAGDLSQQVQNDLAKPLENFKTAKPTYNALSDVSEDLGNFENDNSFKTASDIKDFVSQQIEQSGGFNPVNASEKNKSLRDVYTMIKKKLEDSSEDAADKMNDPDFLKNYLQNKRDYGNAQTARGILEGSVAKEGANNAIGLSDYGAAEVASHMASGPAGLIVGAATVGLKKGLQAYGNNVAALGADKLSDILAQRPEIFGQFASVLENAAKRGSAALAATHYILSQSDPAYRAKTRQAFNQ